MSLNFANPDATSYPLTLLSSDGGAELSLEAYLKDAPQSVQEWVAATGFSAAAGSVCLLPEGGAVSGALVGLGSETDRQRKRFVLGAARAALGDRTYHLETSLSDAALEEQLLGWLLAGYSFDRYKSKTAPKAQLVVKDATLAARLEAIAAGEALTRDLINTPASDMGPAELELAARSLAEDHGAQISVTEGEALLAENFPMIHTVGRASTRSPRLIDMSWGDTGPTLALVGKGVCFDTGGLNLKPGSSMGLMKKDMGGSATVLGLANMIMTLKLPLRLRVLIPAVENAVAGDAFRPQDVLTSRKGLTVEVNNTDAEGRLVLADALALADETPPDLIISMATLTGAARVAVGPELAPFYASVPEDAQAIREGAKEAADPVWEMPFWAPYEDRIEPGIADLDNAPAGGFAGSITAALFLKRFVTNTPRYMHFDIYGWNPWPGPARPLGGVGQGARAILAALPQLLKL